MKIIPNLFLVSAKVLVFALALLPWAVLAQPAPVSPTTAVLAISKPGTNTDQARFAVIFPSEVKATVGLYLEGKITSWYSKKDRRGVVFLMNCTTVEEAQTLLSALPLHQEHFLDFDYMPLGALDPLRVLVKAPEQK